MNRLAVLTLLVPALLASACSDGVDGNRDPQRSESTVEQPPSAASITLEVGHCDVEPLEVNGRLWVTKTEHIGYGGGLPKVGFTESGTFTVVSESRAVFVADGGARITFKPAPAQREPFLCD